MMPRFIIACSCLLALAASIFSDKIGYEEEAITRGNRYIDEIIEEISLNRVEEYDPYLIEDSVVGFNRKVFFVNVSGEVKLHNGYIKGLSTLHRTEDCSLQDEGDRLRVKADLGAGVLEFHYSGSAKFMQFGPTISVEGTMSYIGVHLEFTVDSETGRNGKLDKFIIDDMRGMSVWVTGLGPINWAVNPIVSGVTKIFKRFVRNFLESKVEKHLSEKIPNYQFPVEEDKTTQDPETTGTKTNPTTEPEATDPTEHETSTTKEPEETDPTEPETSTTKEPEETDSAESETSTTKGHEEIDTESETSTTEETDSSEPETSTIKETEKIDTEPETNKVINSPKLDVDSEEIAYLEPDRDASESSSD